MYIYTIWCQILTVWCAEGKTKKPTQTKTKTKVAQRKKPNTEIKVAKVISKISSKKGNSQKKTYGLVDISPDFPKGSSIQGVLSWMDDKASSVTELHQGSRRTWHPKMGAWSDDHFARGFLFWLLWVPKWTQTKKWSFSMRKHIIPWKLIWNLAVGMMTCHSNYHVTWMIRQRDNTMHGRNPIKSFLKSFAVFCIELHWLVLQLCFFFELTAREKKRDTCLLLISSGRTCSIDIPMTGRLWFAFAPYK